MDYKKWVFVPNKQDWYNSKITPKAKTVSQNADFSYNLICDEDDNARLVLFQKFLDELHELIKSFYINSSSFGWVPNSFDTVYWLSTSNPNQILNPIVCSAKNAPDQMNAIYNCYKSDEEVKALKKQVVNLIQQFKF